MPDAGQCQFVSISGLWWSTQHTQPVFGSSSTQETYKRVTDHEVNEGFAGPGAKGMGGVGQA
jgi:hypothetical protein